MSQASEPPDRRVGLQLDIAGILAFAVWIISSIGIYFTPKPFYELEFQSATITQARFLAAALIFVTYVLTFVLKSTATAKGWLTAIGLSLVGTIAAAWLFFSWRTLYTIDYPLDVGGAPRVIGTTLLRAKDRETDPLKLLEQHGGIAEKVWVRAEIVSRKVSLAQSYSLSFALFAVLLISSAQYKRVGSSK